MALEVDPVTPLDAFERRAEWQLVALIVALTVVPFTRAAEATTTRPATAVVVRPVRRSARNRNVRPPRSC